MSMTLSEELIWRGFVNQTTLPDIKMLDERKLAFYHGFDASTDSQTIGNLAAMMFDKVFMRHGHKAVLLAGGATSLIGDPGGKDKERVLQDYETVAQNVENAKKQLELVFKGYEFELVNNLDWYKDMTVLYFLRDVGKHFSMTPLVQRDYIANRMGEDGIGISYTEFSYTILQGYDFWHLHKKYGVELQLSGADQWGNALSGVDYIRRVEGKETHVITCPLVINKSTGKKFGKSEDGAIWLDSKKTSAYKFYQFWLNADDEGVEDYLKIYTELDKSTIDTVISEFQKNRGERLAQKTLAYEVTKLIHGEQQAKSQREIADKMFGGGMFELTDKELGSLSSEFAVVEVSREVSMDNLFSALETSKLSSSRSEARRLLQSGAIYLNNIQLNSDSDFPLILAGNYTLLRRGKNRVALLKRK